MLPLHSRRIVISLGLFAVIALGIRPSFGQDSSFQQPASPIPVKHPQGDKEDAFLQGLIAARSQPPDAFCFEVSQTEADHNKTSVSTIHWQVTEANGDFNATMSAGNHELWVSKRGNTYWHYNGHSVFRFWEDTWEKGHLWLAPSPQFCRKLAGTLAAFPKRYSPLQGDVFSAVVFHVLVDHSPEEYLSRADALSLEQEPVLIGQESCSVVNLIPDWRTRNTYSDRPLGLRPEIKAYFATSDKSLVGLDITISQSLAPGLAPVPWLTFNTRATAWSSENKRRTPSGIDLMVTDIRNYEQALISNTVLFPHCTVAPLPPLDTSSTVAAIDVEPRDQSFYEDILHANPQQLEARLALLRFQANQLQGKPDRDKGNSIRSEIISIEGMATGPAQLPVLIQLSEVAFAAEDTRLAKRLARSVLSIVGNAPEWSLCAVQMQVLRGLCKLERYGAKDEAAQILRAIIPKQDQITNGPVPDEETRHRTQKLLVSLAKAGQITPTEHKMGWIAQMELLRMAIPRSISSRTYNEAYRQWRDSRLEYIQQYLIRDETRGDVKQFISEGMALGLDSTDSTREMFYLYLAMAERELQPCIQCDNENQRVLRFYLGLLNTYSTESANTDLEKERISALLAGSDRAARAQAALEMSSVPPSAVTEPQGQESFLQAVGFGDQLLTASGTSNEMGTLQDVVELLRVGNKLYGTTTSTLVPAMQAAFSLRSKLHLDTQRQVFDAMAVLANSDGNDNQSANEALAPLEPSVRLGSLPLPLDLRALLLGEIGRVREIKPSAQRFIIAISPISTPDQRQKMYATLLIKYYADRAQKTNDVGWAVSYSADLARRTAEFADARRAIENMAILTARVSSVKESRRLIENLLHSFGPNTPRYKIAPAEQVRIWTVSWSGRPRAAVRMHKQLADKYWKDTDPRIADICADSLCHAYAYSVVRLKDPAAGEQFLATIRSRYPDGRYEALMAWFEKGVQRSINAESAKKRK